jgi:plasmid stabilization system protein ParE
VAFQIVFRPRARLDFDAAVAWLARLSPAAATRWRTGFFNILADLEVDPLRYSLADEAADLGIDLRQLLYGRRRNTYRVLFVVEGQTVSIFRLRHTAQDRLGTADV